jgi:hypothetical protein
MRPATRLRIKDHEQPPVILIIKERIDVDLRPRLNLDTDAALIVRRLALRRRILASPIGANDFRTRVIGALDEGAEIAWRLEGPNGPKYICTLLQDLAGNLGALRHAAKPDGA